MFWRVVAQQWRNTESTPLGCAVCARPGSTPGRPESSTGRKTPLRRVWRLTADTRPGRRPSAFTLLVIGRELAVRAASDRLATPAERQAARVFGGYIRARLRRNLDLLDGNLAGLVEVVGDYLPDCDVEVEPQKVRRNAPVVPAGA